MNSQLTEQRSFCWRKRVLRAALWCPWLVVAAAHGDYQTFNSQNHADNAAFRTNWLNAIGIASADVQYKADFEAGFTNGQNISNVADLLPGGLIIRDTSSANAAVVRSGASVVNGSSPVGVFCVTQNEQPYLALDFSASPVDYVAFQDIDHTGTRIVVTFEGGVQRTFSIETTLSGGNISEFVGIWRNDLPRIVRIDCDSSGDGRWGIDEIEYGTIGGGCIGDFNQDGGIDGTDVSDFFAAWEAGSPGADVNQDGGVDGADVDFFFLHWENGC